MKEDKNQNKNLENKKTYTPIDSVIMYFLTIILPTLFFIPFVSTSDGAKEVLKYIIPQVAILTGFLVLSLYRKVNIKKANQINFKINIWVVLIVILIGLISIFGFAPLVNVFDALVGNDPQAISIPNFASLVLKVIYIALLPAVCEELACRGVIANGFKKYGIVVACVLSSVFFALMHNNLEQLVYQLLMGALFTFVALKTGNIVYTMIMHFFNNFAILLNAYILQQNGIVTPKPKIEGALDVILPILYAIAAIGAIVGLLFLINYILKRQKQKALEAKNDCAVIQNDAQNEKDSSNGKNSETEKTYIEPLEKISTIVGFVGAVIIYILIVVLSMTSK